MAIPTWVDGNPLPASDVNDWFVPKAAVKTGTESVTSSTVLQDDDHLFVTVAANAVYRVELALIYDGAVSTGPAAGIKIAFTVPASATYAAVHAGQSTSSAGYGDDQMNAYTSLATAPAGTVGAGATTGLLQFGILTTAGTSGTLRLQWAQNISNGTATRVFAGSHLILWRVG